MINYFITAKNGLILQYGTAINESCIPSGIVNYGEVPKGATYFINGKFENIPDTAWELIVGKQKRNSYLAASDWTQLPDVDLTIAQKDSWKVYRQQLRDMTDEMLISNDFPVNPS